jgi:competence protein ComEC
LDETSRGELARGRGIDPAIYELYRKFKMAGADALKDYEDLLEDPIDVLKRECPGEDVFRFVATHPDMDHLTGLYRLSQQEPGIDILNFWDTDNTKAFKEGEFDKSRYDWRDWQEYQRLRTSTEAPKTLSLYRGSSADYYTADGITILAPTPAIVKDANERKDWNHLSQVHHIRYGQSTLIMAADTTPEVQKEIAALYGTDLKSTLLKAPHHGRETCYCEEFCSVVKADYTIVSVGKKPENDASNKYRKHSKKVLSTRFHGTIYAELDADGTVRIFDHARQRIDVVADLARALTGLSWR